MQQKKDFLRNDFISKPNAKRINMRRLLHESIACFSVKTGLYKKHKAHISKYVPCILKYMACIFTLYKFV